MRRLGLVLVVLAVAACKNSDDKGHEDAAGGASDGSAEGGTAGKGGGASSSGATKTAIKVVAGNSHNCALFEGGAVGCWGDRSYGQLGNPDKRNRAPAVVPGLTSVKDLATTPYGTCAVLTNGTVECWGTDVSRPSEGGFSVILESPTPVAGIKGATAITGGRDAYCVLLDDATVSCWGRLKAARRPMPDLTPIEELSEVAQLSSDGDGICAINKAAELTCFRFDKIDPPRTFAALRDVTSVSATTANVCAVLASGELLCWGDNGFGTLAAPQSLSQTETPTLVDLEDVKLAVTRSRVTCAVHGDGLLSCWGDNNNGAIGNGEKQQVIRTPTAVDIGPVASAVIGDFGHTCAVLVDGSVWCWGYNFYGVLGNDHADSLVPVKVEFE